MCVYINIYTPGRRRGLGPPPNPPASWGGATAPPKTPLLFVALYQKIVDKLVNKNNDNNNNDHHKYIYISIYIYIYIGRGLGRGGSPSPRSRGGLGGGRSPPPTLSRNLYKTYIKPI